MSVRIHTITLFNSQFYKLYLGAYPVRVMEAKQKFKLPKTENANVILSASVNLKYTSSSHCLRVSDDVVLSFYIYI